MEGEICHDEGGRKNEYSRRGYHCGWQWHRIACREERQEWWATQEKRLLSAPSNVIGGHTHIATIMDPFDPVHNTVVSYQDAHMRTHMKEEHVVGLQQKL